MPERKINLFLRGLVFTSEQQWWWHRICYTCTLLHTITMSRFLPFPSEKTDSEKRRNETESGNGEVEKNKKKEIFLGIYECDSGNEIVEM